MRRFVVVLLLMLPAVAWGQLRHTDQERPVPAGLQVTLETDQPEYWLGENVLVHVVVTNTGPEPFKVSEGGDYRAGPRALRFRVTMTDAEGKPAEDPYPPPHMELGGLSPIPKPIPAGGKYEMTVPVMLYAAPSHGGRYKVRIAHDLGYSEVPERMPAGEMELTFRMPDEAQAEKVIDAALALKERNATYGVRAKAYADFRCLRQPVYMAPLLRRIVAGNAVLLKALGEIRTKEATAELVRLAATAPPEIALEAARAVHARLLKPWSPPRPAAASWDEGLAPQVRTVGERFLQSSKPEEVKSGALLLESVGEPSQGGRVLAALDRELQKLRRPRKGPEENVLDAGSPVRDLMRTMRALHDRGFQLGPGLSGDAQLLVSFDWLAEDPAPRDEQWLQRLDAFTQTNCHPVAVAALKSVPKPMPPECAKTVARCLEHEDAGVRMVACNVAGTSGDQRFLPLLLAIVAGDQQPWTLRSATNAAQALGAGLPLLELWAARLPEDGLEDIALDALMTVTTLPRSWSGNRLPKLDRIKQRELWVAFLREHAGEIRAGKKVAPGDPALQPTLVGNRVYRLPDGTDWPPSGAQAPVRAGFGEGK